MRNMFGISPKGVLDINDGYSPSFKKMIVEILRPFRAWVLWLCHSIGLHPILEYYAPSGLSPHSPERAAYNSEVATPLAAYNSEVATPLAAYNSEAVSPLAISQLKRLEL